ncbi:MAG: thermonuclease family protein [Hyphomicrobium sp.]|nr:thermonuclease family protein [Hyphomicrobium sp.]
MQPIPPKQWRSSQRRRRYAYVRPRRAYVRLVLMLTLAAAAIFVGRDHWRVRRAQNEPFPASISGAARPIDGDSLFVGGNEVRLLGIDAPEGRQTCSRGDQTWNCGDEAKLELARAIGGEIVSCDVRERDRYGRLLARCTAGGRDINAAMVQAGMAVAYGGYAEDEADARSSRRGVWSGEFEEPQKWRARHNSEDTR